MKTSPCFPSANLLEGRCGPSQHILIVHRIIPSGLNQPRISTHYFSGTFSYPWSHNLIILIIPFKASLQTIHQTFTPASLLICTHRVSREPPRMLQLRFQPSLTPSRCPHCLSKLEILKPADAVPPIMKTLPAHLLRHGWVPSLLLLKVRVLQSTRSTSQAVLVVHCIPGTCWVPDKNFKIELENKFCKI